MAAPQPNTNRVRNPGALIYLYCCPLSMKVLVIGSGGREHALVWKLRQSRRVSEVISIPGNAGICQEATCVAGDARTNDGLLAVAHQVQPDLTVVGPELPLSLG